MPAFLAIIGGALLLTWPALLNHYPIVFSDTGGLLAMGLEPSMGWDKPWVYGPLLVPIHLRATLFLAVAAQGVLASYVLWLTQSNFSPPAILRHGVLCLLLAAGAAAPWVTATLMPDLFTPLTVLTLFILGYARLRRPHLVAASLIAAIAIAAHLSNLIVASACIVAIALLRRRLSWRPVTPLAAALVFLVASNWIGHGKPAVSPYGSVFALARLVAGRPGARLPQPRMPRSRLPPMRLDRQAHLGQRPVPLGPQRTLLGRSNPAPRLRRGSLEDHRRHHPHRTARRSGRRHPQHHPPTRPLPARRHARPRLPRYGCPPEA